MPAIAAPPTWVLRDYHSPNLLWLAERDGIARIGVLDFQDALIGPAAYDVASLLQDARVDVPEAMEMALLGRYVRARRSDDAEFDTAGFTPPLRHAWRRNGRPKFSASLPGSTGATASRNICVTCPAYGTICALAGAPGAGLAQGLVRRKCARLRMGYDIAIRIDRAGEAMMPKSAIVLGRGPRHADAAV